MISDFWNDQLVAHDRQWLFLVLLGFVLSFAFIRLSTRLMRSPRVPWWPGSVVSDSGVHVHHLVFGIVAMMAAGTISFAGFATSPIYEICAVVFGVGMGLTIDEFALWLHLEDVYWSKEGRSSIDATLLAVAFIFLALIGIRPIDLEGGSPLAVIASVVGLVLYVLVIAICFAKHRYVHGSLGIIANPLAFYGACRLGKPDSAWARRFYGERNPKKQRKAEARFHPNRRTDRFKDAVRDAIGGSTEDAYRAKLEERGREG